LWIFTAPKARLLPKWQSSASRNSTRLTLKPVGHHRIDELISDKRRQNPSSMVLKSGYTPNSPKSGANRRSQLRPYLDYGILELDTDVTEQPLFQFSCGFGGFSRQASTIFG